jgi:hypothetical protein
MHTTSEIIVYENGDIKWVDDVLDNQSAEVIETMKGLSKEALFDMYLKKLPEPIIEPEVSVEEVPDIKAKEFFEGVLNMDWMSEEEKQTIYDATELYAQGRVRYASLSKKEVGEGKDLEVSVRQDSSPIVSHTCTDGNSIEQRKDNKELKDGFGYEWWEG